MVKVIQVNDSGSNEPIFIKIGPLDPKKVILAGSKELPGPKMDLEGSRWPFLELFGPF